MRPRTRMHRWPVRNTCTSPHTATPNDATTTLSSSYHSRTYVTEWKCTLQTRSDYGVGHDVCFAELFVHYSPYHWPAPEMLRAWLTQWPAWERAADPPSWFTEEWQRHALGVIQPELLPEEVRPRSTVPSSRTLDR